MPATVKILVTALKVFLVVLGIAVLLATVVFKAINLGGHR